MKRQIVAYGIWALGLSFTISSDTAQAQVGSFVHVVKQGETLASIAQRFYGDALFEKVLVTENGLSGYDGVSIAPGMRIVIPYSAYYRVARGDSWNKLGEQFYGAAERGSILPLVNGLSKDNPPEQNAQILIPYAVRHIADQRDDLASICEAYFGSTENVGLLRKFNRLSRNRLKKSQLILVPIPKLLLSDQGRKIIEELTGIVLANSSVRTLQDQSAQRIAQLREYVRRGHYIEGVAYGHELLGAGVLTANQTVVVQSELATAYVALERDDLAVKAFEAALKLRSDLELDTAKTSPKVLLMLKKAQKLQR